MKIFSIGLSDNSYDHLVKEKKKQQISFGHKIFLIAYCNFRIALLIYTYLIFN